MIKRAIIIEKYLRTFFQKKATMQFRIIGVIPFVRIWTRLQGYWNVINIDYCLEKNYL
jgi:hypothetical protein